MRAAAEGHYHRKLLGCESTVIAWSHRSRFDMALRLIGPTPRRLLDYGCGDGTFLAMAADRVEVGWGADIAAGQVADCQARLAALRNLRFSTIADLSAPAHAGGYDVVTCMETLEHCTPPVVEVVLGDLARLVAADGRVVISVPIEIGPTFLVKKVVRTLAAWRGLSDYRYYERYTPRNAARMIAAGPSTALARPPLAGPDGPYLTHYGFNWRAMREQVRRHLTVDRTTFSPVGWLGGWVSSQAWFLCRPKYAAPPRPGNPHEPAPGGE